MEGPGHIISSASVSHFEESSAWREGNLVHEIAVVCQGLIPGHSTVYWLLLAASRRILCEDANTTRIVWGLSICCWHAHHVLAVTPTSTNTAQHQHFQSDDRWILENEDGSLQKQITSLTADQRGKSTQMSNFYAQTQRPHDPIFPPAHSLPQILFQSRGLIKSPTLAQQVLHSSCVPRSQPL